MEGRLTKMISFKIAFITLISILDRSYFYIYFFFLIQYTGHSVTHVQQFDFNQNKILTK